MPFEETLLGVDALIRAGKVRWFGGSDHTGNRIIEARIACGQLGVAPMVALQKHYNLMHRTEYEGDLARVAASQSLGVMPRFALASGFLAGKYRSKGRPRRASAAPRRRSTSVAGDSGCSPRSTPSLPNSTRASRRSRSLGCSPEPTSSHPWCQRAAPTRCRDLVAAPALRLTRHHVADLERASQLDGGLARQRD